MSKKTIWELMDEIAEMAKDLEKEAREGVEYSEMMMSRMTGTPFKFEKDPVITTKDMWLDNAGLVKVHEIKHEN